MRDTITRVATQLGGSEPGVAERALAGSFLVSADMAHAQVGNLAIWRASREPERGWLLLAVPGTKRTACAWPALPATTSSGLRHQTDMDGNSHPQ